MSNARSWEDQAVLDFTSSTRRVLELEEANRTWQHIALSVVGATRLDGLAETSLVPDAGAKLGATTLDQWRGDLTGTAGLANDES